MRSSMFLGAIVLLLTVLAGCDGDGVTRSNLPTPPLWKEITPSDLVGQSAVVALASRAGRTLAVVSRPNGQQVLEFADEIWLATDLSLDSFARARDLAIDSQGRAIVVGGHPTRGLLVWAERPDWIEVPVTGAALLQTVTVDASDVFHATGFGSPAAPSATGTAEGPWSTSTISTPGDPQEKGLVAITSDASGLYACGWDDGSDGSPEQPYRLVMHDDGTGWKLLTPPDCDCLDREFTAIAADGRGHVYVGGSLLDFRMESSDRYVAFLLRFDVVAKTWTEVELPDPGGLDRVNRTLVTSSEDLLLACGQEEAGAIVRLPADGESAIEWTNDEAGVVALAETGDGALLAGGAITHGSTIRAALWQRR